MERRKQIESEAKKRGVVLSGSTLADAPAAATVRSTGWLSKVMPHGADLMASLKAQLDPDIYAGIIDRLRRGGGYVLDLSTNIAVGSPPVDEWERGRVQTRGGLSVMRVRRKG